MAEAKIKICGLSTPATLEAAIAARADYAGFMFFPPSPRHLGLADAALLSARAAGRIKRIGVFVDPGDALLATTLAAVPLDGLQLHGNETPERVAELRARYGVLAWKVLSVASRADIDRAAAYAGAADLVLLDAKTPKGADLPGGMGLAFDWSLLSDWKPALPWALAGGLSPANVAEAIRMTGATLVDASSSVESAPGIKDEAKIAAFCAAARGA